MEERQLSTGTRGKPDAGEALGIQSIEVGLKLLRPMIEAGAPMNLKALAAAAGYAPPKAHRYLVSLIRMKLVTQDPITGRYGLGELAFELGLAAIGLLDQEGLGRQAIREIRAETRHTSCLVVWANGGATVAAVEPGVGSIFLGIRVGSILSLLRSASGRAFLTYMPLETIEHVLKAELAEMPLEPSALAAITEEVRREGVSRIRDTMMVGLSAVSAPIFDHDGRLAYVLTTLGQSEAFDTSADGEIVRIMQGKAEELSARLGFRARMAG
jgi:DNA-binding IclR family transcriptional regulator